MADHESHNAAIEWKGTQKVIDSVVIYPWFKAKLPVYNHFQLFAQLSLIIEIRALNFSTFRDNHLQSVEIIGSGKIWQGGQNTENLGWF